MLSNSPLKHHLESTIVREDRAYVFVFIYKKKIYGSLTKSNHVYIFCSTYD